jgi:hypothetical protein
VRNFTQCDSLLLGDECGAHTVPYIEVKNPTAQIEHEATTSKISDDQLFYAMQRGLDAGRGGGADRQRLREGSAAATADGIRGGGAEAAGHFMGPNGAGKSTLGYTLGGRPGYEVTGGSVLSPSTESGGPVAASELDSADALTNRTSAPPLACSSASSIRSRFPAFPSCNSCARAAQRAAQAARRGAAFGRRVPQARQGKGGAAAASTWTCSSAR